LHYARISSSKILTAQAPREIKVERKEVGEEEKEAERDCLLQPEYIRILRNKGRERTV
jgi:sRNA-binding carbon storage regulator CsrA